MTWPRQENLENLLVAILINMANKENKNLMELGSKARAGHLLSNYLRAIADERTELADVVISPDKIERRLISKAEAIARDMFRLALPLGPGVEVGPENAVGEKTRLEYRKLILERIDGKPGTEEQEKEGDKIPEKISEILDQWAYLKGVELDFSRPGRPTDNAFIEAFNGRFREECLNENWFL